MTITPAQVEAKLVALSREYDEAHEQLELAEVEYAKAKSAWEINSAKCRMSIRSRAIDAGRKVTIQEVEDEAMVRCSEEQMQVTLTEALVRAARANSVRLRTQIDVARSVGTSVRAAMDMG